MTAILTEPTLRQLIEAAALAPHGGPVAEHTPRLWRTLAPELISIIGERGFDALYSRCVRLARREHPWLRQDGGAAPAGGDIFTPLEQSLQAQDTAPAAQASLTLFIIFFDTLTALIGEALTTHLLRSAWSPKRSDPQGNNFND